jgi:hypothetical protein
MRRFSSYGPVSKESHYYVPRTELLRTARASLLGDNPAEGGHYITVWASRQSGKSWLLRELAWELAREPDWIVAKIELEILRNGESIMEAARYIISSLNTITGISIPLPRTMVEFEACFSSAWLKKPLILILDEFDVLGETVIAGLVSSLRNIYLTRLGEQAVAREKRLLLHGVALIGVRSVVGVDNRSGSPFNVQRSLHIPNLTEAEVKEMYHWYERESGQHIESEVIDRIWEVTRGQPGLVSWFGELLTEQYNKDHSRPLGMEDWNLVYSEALHTLPNNSIINLVSKARTEPYRQTVLELFRTGGKVPFEFEDPQLSYLYMNGVITWERSEGIPVARFPCQFVQEKLFRAFAREMYGGVLPPLPDPFADLTPVIDETRIDTKRLLALYQDYFLANRDYILSYAPRRADNRVYEAVYHFNLYAWLENFLRGFQGSVIPEFPTGNGKIDLLLKYRGGLYGLELKSFAMMAQLKDAIVQAGRYGQSLGLASITLAVFVERPLPEDKKPLFAEPFRSAEGASVDVVFLVVG